MDNPKPELLWIDMETTGLRADEEVPIELGFMLTDNMGRRIDTWASLIWEATPSFQRKLHTASGDQIVGPMHSESGLWNDLLDNTNPRISRQDAEGSVVGWLMYHDIEKGQLPLIGSSIGSLDRPFLIKHFPYINDYLSYRNIDVSTLKELCKRHNPELFAELEKQMIPKENVAHRVTEDIEASIHEYSLYLDNFLKVAQ